MNTASPKLAYLVFSIWAALGLAAVLAGLFATSPGAPSTGLAVQLVGVSAAGLLLVTLWPALSRSVRGLDPAMLTTLQSWRILGLMFVFLMALGDLPAIFAVPAGVGDLLVGLAAPFVAARMRRGSLTRRGFGWFTALGLLDFVAAFAFGNYVNLTVSPDSGFASMTALPLVLVPGFFVPAFALLHLAAWVSFRDRSAAASPRSVAGEERKSRRTVQVASLLLLGALAPQLAGAQTSIGGAYGASRLGHGPEVFGDASWSAVKEDDADSGWKVFVDHRVSRHLGVEIGFVDLNNDTDSETTFVAVSDGSGPRFAPGAVSVDLDEPRAAYAALVGRFPLGDRVGAFLKGGLHVWEADVTTVDAAGQTTAGESGEDGFVGVGLEGRLGRRLWLRAELERFFGIVGDDFDLASIGLAVRLGAGRTD